MKRALLLSTLLLVSGCISVDNPIDRAVDSAMRSAGEQVGKAVGERVGAMVVGQFPANWNQQWTTMYVSYLFNVAFHSGSYQVSNEPYEAGEWTEWRMIDAGEETSAVMRRAFLAETEDGNQWWQIVYENTESDEEMIVEGLFSPDRSELLRLRALLPGEEEPQELPVQEGTYGYAQPVQLTEESVEGASKGMEEVNVPAGTFTAQHIEYGAAGATMEWWLEESVPGGMVKYTRDAAGATSDETMPSEWAAELTAYGDDAESRLDVM